MNGLSIFRLPLELNYVKGAIANTAMKCQTSEVLEELIGYQSAL